MHGHLLPSVDNPQLRGVDPERDLLPHQRHRRGVTVAVVTDPGVGRDRHGENLVGVERHRRQRAQMRSFFLESVDGALVRGGVHTDVGHVVAPGRGRDADKRPT